MNTLIIPCAGKSSRFPNMKPKYMLIHPDGKLMLEKSIEGINLDIFDRIIVTIIKHHDDQYGAELIVRQAFKNKQNIEICVLDNFTKSASETVYLTLTRMEVTGSFVVKDSDNRVEVLMNEYINNSIVCLNIHEHKNLTNIQGKSFLLINNSGYIDRIVEKRIVSNLICVGIYCFESALEFINAYHAMKTLEENGGLYISHVITYMIATDNNIFAPVIATSFDDYGTLCEWNNIKKRHQTYFVDVDGILIKYTERCGAINWHNYTILKENLDVLLSLQIQGAQIVLISSRSDEYRHELEQLFKNIGLEPYAILMGMNYSTKILINSFSDINPYPSGRTISVPCNGLIKD